MLSYCTKHRRVGVNNSQAFIVVGFMILTSCSSVPSQIEDPSASEHQRSHVFHEQRIESGLFGNTIQYWLLHHGLREDQKPELDDQHQHQSVDQSIDQPMNRQAEQRLGRPTIQKPDRQVVLPRSQQPVQRFNRPNNRQLDRRN